MTLVMELLMAWTVVYAVRSAAYLIRNRPVVIRLDDGTYRVPRSPRGR